MQCREYSIQGLCSGDFKGKWAKYAKSLMDKGLAEDTGLAEDIWRRMDWGQETKVVFKVVRGAAPNTPDMGR